MMEENENPKTMSGVLAEVMSKLKAPGLKTLGKFLAVQDSSIGESVNQTPFDFSFARAVQSCRKHYNDYND